MYSTPVIVTRIARQITFTFIIVISFAIPLSKLQANTAKYATAGYAWENNSLGIDSSIPTGFAGILHTPAAETRIDNRLYRLEDTLLPSQLGLKDRNLLRSPIEIAIELDGENEGTKYFSSEVVESTKSTLRIRNVEQSNKLQKTVEIHVDFDGFLKIDVTIQPLEPLSINHLSLQIDLDPVHFTHFERHLTYDFNTQRIERSDLLSSKGLLTDIGALPFLPSLWIGSTDAGLEYLSETNAHYNLRKPKDAFTLEFNNAKSRLTNTLINKQTKIDKEYKFSIGLLVTPVKRDTQISRQTILTNKIKNKLKVSNLNRLYIGHWKRDKSSLPGIPTPASENGIPNTVYTKTRQNLKASGTAYIPYAALHIMPTTLPELDHYRNDWEAAAARKGTIHWKKRIGKNKSVQPISLESKSIQDYIIYTHTKEITDNQIDGMYFDVSTPVQLKRTTARYLESRQHPPINKSEIIYYPIFEYREFLKRYWKASKALDDTFQIVHHGMYLPHFAESFVDMKAYGESIHNLFKKREMRPKKQKINGEEQLLFKRPEHYVPDYLSLPEHIMPGTVQSGSPTTRVILPQIEKFNKEYLENNLPLYQRWTRGLIGRTLIADQRIWNTRLHVPTFSAIWNWLGKFEGFEQSTHKRVLTGLPEGVNLARYETPGNLIFVLTNSSDKAKSVELNTLLNGIDVNTIQKIELLDSTSPSLDDPKFIVPSKDILLGNIWLNTL